ncbi:unnamed protein product, partial [Ectocarpus sp. 13 AM-2016]
LAPQGCSRVGYGTARVHGTELSLNPSTTFLCRTHNRRSGKVVALCAGSVLVRAKKSEGGGSRVVLACLEVVRHVPRFFWCIFCYFTVPPRSHHKQQQQRNNRVRLVCWCSTGKIAFEKITVSVPREGTEPAAVAP